MSNTTPPPPPPGPGQDPFSQQAPAAPQPPAYGSAPQPPAYGAMPGAPAAAPAGPITAPATMANAVKLMRVGAGLSLVSALTPFIFQGQIRDSAEAAAEAAGAPLSPDVLDGAVTLALGMGVVSGLIGLALWLWMASANGKGKSWARTTSMVFFGLSLVSFLFSFTQPQPILSRILSVATIVVGAGALFFMMKPESKAFYEASSAPRG